MRVRIPPFAPKTALFTFGTRGGALTGFGEAGRLALPVLAVMLAEGRGPARGDDTSKPAGSRATLCRAIARRSMAPTTLSPSGRGVDATPRSRFFDPTTSVRSEALEKVAKDMDRDYYMTAEDAKNYGIIDRVIEHR